MLARSRHLLDLARCRLESASGPVHVGLLTLAKREVNLVERFWRGTHHVSVRRAAMTISWLGNGLIYPFAGFAVLTAVEGSTRATAAAGVAGGVGHVIYPWLKSAVHRPRPFALQRLLRPPMLPLDRYSFPSGHIMTLTAVLTPFVLRYPAIWPGAVTAWLALSWSRIACAHHYPSDVAAGCTLGLLIALPVSWASGLF